MNKQEIFKFLTENPIGFLATVDGKAARVRGMDTFRADEKGLILYTGKAKDVFKQLVKNPEVEICYFAKGIQVRVRGKIEVVEDMALKNEIVEKRAFLKQIHQPGYATMAVCRLKGKATVWSMQDMAAPMTFIDL
jgi:pyridoxamine 5'-phosphate oxidase